ncbi:MAG TPA: MFS transporter [Gemmatimonadales bacterium]|nr:MFS transporter [Gemmatimonadales bacterium]
MSQEAEGGPSGPPSFFRGTFRSLEHYNYRVWAAGAIISNVGTWMQRTAQDWLVLTELTHRNATSVGIVMGLQFGPQLLFLPLTGLAADRLNRRNLLLATQAMMGLLALGLGILTLSGAARLWQVYIFALLLGCVAAFDAPARQTFVSDLVPEEQLSNAVALNSTSFNIARLIGPAIAGILIALVGTGWVFVLNAASYLAVLASIRLLRASELQPRQAVRRARENLLDGFRYVAQRPDILCVLIMFGLIGTLGINFPIFISTMAVGVFHAGAGEFGALTSMMAIGSVGGALLAARRERPRFTFLILGATMFGLGLLLAAVMPSYVLFSAMLILVGLSAQTFTATANGAVQLWTTEHMRGRVMAILLAVALGGTPFGAPLVGWVADTFGPRASLTLGAGSGFAAALVGAVYVARRLVKPPGLRAP